MTKFLVIHTLCPHCRKVVSITLTEQQYEEAGKMLEKQKSLDLTREIAERMRKTRAGGIA